MDIRSMLTTCQQWRGFRAFCGLSRLCSNWCLWLGQKGRASAGRPASAAAAAGKCGWSDDLVGEREAAPPATPKLVRERCALESWRFRGGARVLCKAGCGGDILGVRGQRAPSACTALLCICISGAPSVSAVCCNWHSGDKLRLFALGSGGCTNPKYRLSKSSAMRSSIPKERGGQH